MKIRALFSAAGLSALFFVVYSTTNSLAAQRTGLDTWCYDWELGIPFVPLMILPYMSIDLFFVCAPFLCSDRQELKLFSARIASTILIAGFFFYFYPLQLVFQRQPVEGWLGLIFNPFIELDQPQNLLPSLHIALRTILAHFYASKTKGLLHAIVQVWFSLIGFSTLFTHQHHVVDVIGGFALALW